jgi:hypothetical protein
MGLTNDTIIQVEFPYKYEGFEDFKISLSSKYRPLDLHYCRFKMQQFTDHILLMDIKAADDFIMLPGEAKHIDTNLRITCNNKISIVAGDMLEVISNTKMTIISSTTFRIGTEPVNDVETTKFILHNYEIPMAYPIKVPGDKSKPVMTNKVRLINGEEVDSTVGLVAANSYFIKKDDFIARLVITKLGG